MACNSGQTDQTASASPTPGEIVKNDIVNDNEDYYAKDNFDLNAVGALLEKSNDAENFEFLINSDNRANNLDLNGLINPNTSKDKYPVFGQAFDLASF